jgi:hypothetical protein
MNGDPKDNSNGEQKSGVTTCRARKLGLSNLVECNTKVHRCSWHLPFGEGMLCAHPSNSMIAMGALPTGWSLPRQM